MSTLRALWAYRGFVLGSVRREFQLKYRNSLLGAAWNILGPLSMILIHTVIFSGIMKARLPGVQGNYAFSIYLCAGVLAWGLFAEITNRATLMFVDNANLLKKSNFPRLCLPVIVVSNAVLNFSIVFSLFLIFLLFSGQLPDLPLLAMFPLILLLVAFAIGLGTSLGMLHVFFRDIGQFLSIFLNFWFWLTPIVYPVSILPPDIASLARWNPMFPLITACQDVLLHNRWPDWSSLWPLALLAAFLCLYGLSLFRRRSGEMVDEL